MSNIYENNINPTFLVGAERSGTTLLRLMLDRHPDIAWCSEFEYAVDKITDDGNFPEVKAYCESVEPNFIFRAHGFKLNDRLTYPELIKDFLKQRQTEANKPLIGATCHRNFHRLLYIWPEAKFMHIVRDPRDVARSCIGMGWAGNTWYGVDGWMEAEKAWEILKQKVSSSRCLEISYERFITDNKTVLEEMCDFMGTKFNGLMFDYEDSTEYKLPDPGLIFQWKKKASKEEVQMVEAKVGNLLEDRVYQSSNFPTIYPSRAKRAHLRLQNYLFKLENRIKTFGFILFMADFLSRKLNLKKWQRTIILEMNDIILANIKHFDGNPQILEARKRRGK